MKVRNQVKKNHTFKLTIMTRFKGLRVRNLFVQGDKVWARLPSCQRIPKVSLSQEVLRKGCRQDRARVQVKNLTIKRL